MRPPFIPIPVHLQALYVKLRITLAIILLAVGIGVAHAFLFPTIITSFDFRNPNSSRNQIFDPRSPENVPRTNGKVEAEGSLVANTSPLGDFSHLSVALDLEKKSETPNLVEIAVRKNYRAFLFPIGTPVTDFPSADLYRVDDTYYALRDNRLHPFVSESAFLSRYPLTFAKTSIPELRSQYAVATEFLGFRVGSLLSFADGVFVVVSETEIRPIGSAEIFLTLGYRFEDVIPANEEDLGIYKRGRILLMGAPHPDGTLFQDASSDSLYLTENGQRRPIVDEQYRDFLRQKAHPIIALEPSDQFIAHCTATASFFPRALNCELTLDSLANAVGPDYEITLSGTDTNINIATATLAFETRLDAKNMTLLLSKMKQRLLARFGLTPP